MKYNLIYGISPSTFVFLKSFFYQQIIFEPVDLKCMVCSLGKYFQFSPGYQDEFFIKTFVKNG